MQCNKRHARAAMIYSITSSAPGAEAGHEVPRTLAAHTLMTYSTFVDLRLAGTPLHLRWRPNSGTAAIRRDNRRSFSRPLERDDFFRTVIPP